MEAGYVGGCLAPSGFRAAAERPEAGARDVGQDAVEGGRTPWDPESVSRKDYRVCGISVDARNSRATGAGGVTGAARTRQDSQGLLHQAGAVRAGVCGD
jgi:hypothetical protein